MNVILHLEEIMAVVLTRLIIVEADLSVTTLILVIIRNLEVHVTILPLVAVIVITLQRAVEIMVVDITLLLALVVTIHLEAVTILHQAETIQYQGQRETLTCRLVGIHRGTMMTIHLKVVQCMIVAHLAVNMKLGDQHHENLVHQDAMKALVAVVEEGATRVPVVLSVTAAIMLDVEAVCRQGDHQETT